MGEVRDEHERHELGNVPHDPPISIERLAIQALIDILDQKNAIQAS